jgi:hypothetical protein
MTNAYYNQYLQTTLGMTRDKVLGWEANQKLVQLNRGYSAYIEIGRAHV